MSLREVSRFAGRHAFVALPFLFYYLTAAPSIGMSDTAILIFDIQDLRLSTTSNSHNLTVLLGRLFSYLPVGSLAFRGNLMSVFFGGLTVALFYGLLVECFRSRTVAAITASILMVSHSLWWHSTIVESYAINACLIVAALHLLARYRADGREAPLLGLIFLAGIAVFQHAQLGVIGLAALIVATGHIARLARDAAGRSRLPGLVARAALVSAVSLAPWGLTFARDAFRAGSLGGALSTASGGEFKAIMFQWAGGIGVVDTLLLTILQFPSPFLLIIPVGLALFLQRWEASASTVAVLAIFLTNTVFFAFYHTWDRFAFLLVSFVILAFWGAFAVDQLVAWMREGRRRGIAGVLALASCVSVLAPPYVYAHMDSWHARPDSVWAMRFGHDADAPTIDSVRYNANPDKHRYTDIDEFCALLAERLPANAIYVTDDAFFFTLEYYLVYGGRRADLGVGFVNSWGFAGWGLSPAQLTTLLDYARDAGLPLFLERLDAPFDRLVGPAGRSYAFAPFDLDERRRIHRLVTAAEEGEPTGPPFVPRSRGTTVLARRFGADDPLTVRFEFEENPEAFPVTYRWIGPSGRARFSSPVFIVPAGSGTAGWVQERAGVLTPGPWRVEVWVGAVLVDSTELTAQ